ncbi:putative nuclease HARBI1 [Anoplophora glabripennis]|uniref:putative nuclease HARBI1 n=1 Tax=Anoplophora glabripennis TaxID=217634 RepID=UPI000873F0AB|nr:putative nuclease HARBI1 [Anoplophora glabripennis]
MEKRKRIRKFSRVIIPYLIAELEMEINNKKKRIWSRQWLLRRQHGASATIIKELENEDTKEYRLFLRMNLEQFSAILENISAVIAKSDTIMRDSIPAKIKLQITLTYLATGNNYRTLQHLFRVSKSAISRFIPEVLDAVYSYLKEYIKVPANQEEWKVIENGFRIRWNFPGCCGVIDGKHVAIQAPGHCGSEFWNYKGTNSIVLMAIVNHDYCFSYINTGATGRNSDGGIFRNCSIYHELENGGILPDGGLLDEESHYQFQEDVMKLKRMFFCAGGENADGKCVEL